MEDNRYKFVYPAIPVRNMTVITLDRVIESVKDDKVCVVVRRDGDVVVMTEKRYDELRAGKKELEILKKYSKNISIGVDIVDKEECCAMVILHVGDKYIQIYETHVYEEVLELKKLQEWLNGKIN